MELKIIYFNFPFWRAEVARIPLYISNTKFEDKRITSEEFSYIKENGKMTDGTIIPFSQLPVLVIDGQVLLKQVQLREFVVRLVVFIQIV